MSTVYRIGHLERLTLKTPYPAQIERIRFIMGRLPRETSLVVDFTGVGRGIYDMLVDAGLSPIGVTIHSGFEVHSNGNVFSVPKSTIVSTLVARLHSGELVVHKDLKHWPVLRRELLNFRPEITRTGQETWNARSGSMMISSWLSGSRSWCTLARCARGVGFLLARASRLRSTRLRTDVEIADPGTRAGNGASVVPAG